MTDLHTEVLHAIQKRHREGYRHAQDQHADIEYLLSHVERLRARAQGTEEALKLAATVERDDRAHLRAAIATAERLIERYVAFWSDTRVIHEFDGAEYVAWGSHNRCMQLVGDDIETFRAQVRGLPAAEPEFVYAYCRWGSDREERYWSLTEALRRAREDYATQAAYPEEIRRGEIIVLSGEELFAAFDE